MNSEKLKAIKCLKTARGQLDGILKMIEEERYCVEVSNQIISAQSLLKKANLLILRQHLNNCLKNAFLKNEGEEKVDEIIYMLEKLIER